jgi:hypothetical protein
MDDVIWLGEARDGEYVALRVGRSGDELIAEWVGIGRLRARRDGSSPRFDPMPGADEAQVEKVRKGAVRLFLRHLEGKIGLHAAAVARDGRAVALVGASGDGKSTLAAALCARGADLLADDSTAIDATPEGWTIVPFEDAHWLDDVACARVGLSHPTGTELTKERVPAVRVATKSARAAAVVVLAFVDTAEAPRMTRLAGVDAAAVLVPMTLRFVVDDPAIQRRELDALSDLVASVPVYRLERKRELAYLDATCDLVERAIES